jgi:hypothetical protein
MKQTVSKHLIAIIFALVGAIGGFLYWKFVGCKSGTCAIKSNWYLMTLYGIFAGYLVGDIISGYTRKFKEKDKPVNES